MKTAERMPVVMWQYILLLCFMIIGGCLLFSESKWAIPFLFGLPAIGATIYLLLFNKELLIILCFFLVPLSMGVNIGWGIQVGFPAELIVVVMAGLFFLLYLKKWPVIDVNVLLHPLTILILTDLLWLYIATIFSAIPEVSFKRILLKTAFVLFFYFFIIHWFRFRNKLAYPLIFYGIGLVPVILLTLNKHASYDFTHKVAFNIPQPFYVDHTIYGACLAFILPILVILFFRYRKFGLNKINRLLAGGGMLLFAGATFYSFSRASLLSLVVVAGFFILLKLGLRMRGLLILMAVTLVLAISAVYFLPGVIFQGEAVSNRGSIKQHFQSMTNLQTDASNLERINRWVCAIDMFKDRPITGFGPGTYQFEYGNYQTYERLTYISTFAGDRGNAHSEYLTYLAEAGLPGFIIFLLLVCITISTGIKVTFGNHKEPLRLIGLGVLLGLTTFFFHGLLNAFWEQEKMAALVYPAMACLVAIDVFNRGEKPTAH
ncbi:MAG: O-antigen ligase family protein [Bacteroidota bacterium]